MIARLLLLLPCCFSAADAFGQTAKELVGSWTLISVTVNRDGEKIQPFGTNPKGTMIGSIHTPRCGCSFQHATVRC